LQFIITRTYFMANAYPRVASVIAVTYVVVALGSALLHFSSGGHAYTIRFNTTHLILWLEAILAIIIAYGLWQRYSWAWWLGIGAAAWQLFRLGSRIFKHFSLSHPPGAITLFIAALLIGFLVLLFQSKTRTSCNR
jgi:translocator protein